MAGGGWGFGGDKENPFIRTTVSDSGSGSRGEEREPTCDKFEDDGVLAGVEGPLEGDDHLEGLPTPQHQVGDLIVTGVVGMAVHDPAQVHLLRLQLTLCKEHSTA